MTSVLKIPATYMRGGTSKGLFINLDDLPPEARAPGRFRDKILLRAIGSPDPYGKQIDGLGGATSSTSKVVLVSRSQHSNYDVDYTFGQVSIGNSFIDWSGNCGNLSSAVGPFAVHAGLIDKGRLREDGILEVRVWQVNLAKEIVVHVPVQEQKVVEMGDFYLDGVAFPAAEIKVDFLRPSANDGSLFPTGNRIDKLEVPELGVFDCTFINSGIPSVILSAKDVNLSGVELQEEVNNRSDLLARVELIRAYGALKMGLIDSIEQAQESQHTPKILFLSPARTYTSSSNSRIDSNAIDLVVRAFSMGKMHHAMMGTAAVALASAASVPGTLVSDVVGSAKAELSIGHPSGKLKVGACGIERDSNWSIERATMSRSARILMKGEVFVPLRDEN